MKIELNVADISHNSWRWHSNSRKMAASMFKIAPFRIGAARSVGGAAAGGGEDGRGEGGGDAASAVRIPPPPVSFFWLLQKSMIVNKILRSMFLQLYVRSKRIVCHSFEKV